MTSRNWCFTLFGDENVTGILPGAYLKSIENITNKKGDGICRYIIQQREKCPESGKIHIQGYAEFVSPVRFSVLQKHFGEKCHCEPRKGTQEEAINYCKKEDSRVTMYCEEGTPAAATGNMNAESKIEWIKSHPGAELNDFIEQFETEYLRYSNSMEKLWNMYKFVPKSFLHDKLLPIQEDIIKLMENQDDRDIPWVYDKEGGHGKSELCNYLIDRGDVFWCSTGGYKDTFHAYSKNMKPYVVIDITREEGMCDKKIDHIYGILEAFKNGRAFSGKYDSVPLAFTKAKVLVLANTVPDPHRWSSVGERSRYKSIVSLSRGEGNTILAPLSWNVTKKIFHKGKCEINLNLD